MKVKTTVKAGSGGLSGGESGNGGQLVLTRYHILLACGAFLYFGKSKRRHTMKVKTTIKAGNGGSGGVSGGGQL